MRTLTVTLLLAFALPCSSYACSGTALVSADAGDNFDGIKQGQHYDDLDHLLRDRKNGQVLVCADDKCFPAIALNETGKPVETMRLQGCDIARKSSNDNGLERHEISTPGFRSEPDQDEDR